MATLTVVMIMFFVMAMVAAYTNRNLIFEQRTSANSYHSAQALAAAEAGVDWAVAMLNGGAIDNNCISSAGQTDFRSRYFSLSFDGSFVGQKWANPNPSGDPLLPSPSCVMTDAGWNCSCPNGPTPTLVGTADDAAAVFSVRLRDSPRPSMPAFPGSIAVDVRGCTSAITGTGGNVNDSEACQAWTNAPHVDGKTHVRVLLGLVSALPVPPVATLTAGGTIMLQATSNVIASNSDPNTATVLHAGAAIVKNGTSQFSGPAGNTAGGLESVDSVMGSLANTSGDFFQSVFGMTPQDYRNQPATFQLTCAGGCTASADISTALLSNPTRVMWINGNLTIDQSIGTATQPVMIVATGTVTFTDSTATVNGVIYSSGNMSWPAAGGVLKGALITNGSFSASGSPTLIYDQAIVRRIRQSYGSFVRTPGSWRTIEI